MKKWRLSFKQMVIIGFLAITCIFVLAIFPFVGGLFRNIVYDALKDSAYLLIEQQLEKADSEQNMIYRLKEAHEYLFFRASLYNAQGELIYDSTLESMAQQVDYSAFTLSQKLVQNTLKNTEVYTSGQSLVYKQKLLYVLIAFKALDNTYILRTALPSEPLPALTLQAQKEFLLFCFITVLFFWGCLWLVFHAINYPIRRIIKAIEPYRSGKEAFLSPIELSISEKDKFYQLAQTLNSLSERVRTQIKQLIEERNEKEAILESLGEGVIAIDKEMRISYANYIGCKMIGLPKKKLLGKTFTDLLSESDFPLLEKSHQLLDTCQKKMTMLTDSIFITDGKKLYLDLIAAPKPQYNGAINGAILVLQDKSSHHKVLEMGKDFVANASHELRTPITIIRGFAETLHDLPELPKEMVSDITEKIVRNCQRMDNLVKNLLTLADLENLPESRFHACDLVNLIENCKQVVLSLYEDARISLEKFTEAIIVDADPDILELAIINLMDNAAKYSHAPAKISIKLDQVGEEVRISVADQGIGIPSEDIEHVFERFYTVNKAHSRRLGGAGLGLSIVKTIIDKHHGTISLASVLGKGTVFTITLPIHRTAVF